MHLVPLDTKRPRTATEICNSLCWSAEKSITIPVSRTRMRQASHLQIGGLEATPPERGPCRLVQQSVSIRKNIPETL